MPRYESRLVEALYKISKEQACPQCGDPNYHGVFTMIDVPKSRSEKIRGSTCTVASSTYLLVERDDMISIEASDPVTAHQYFLIHSTESAEHYGEIPVRKGCRKRPGTERVAVERRPVGERLIRDRIQAPAVSSTRFNMDAMLNQLRAYELHMPPHPMPRFLLDVQDAPEPGRYEAVDLDEHDYEEDEPEYDEEEGL